MNRTKEFHHRATELMPWWCSNTTISVSNHGTMSCLKNHTIAAMVIQICTPQSQWQPSIVWWSSAWCWQRMENDSYLKGSAGFFYLFFLIPFLTFMPENYDKLNLLTTKHKPRISEAFMKYKRLHLPLNFMKTFQEKKKPNSLE